MKSLCIFVHFDKNDVVADYVVQYLQELNKIVDDIVFVSTARLDELQVEKIREYTIHQIVRENIGYDFMSWQVGLRSVPDYEKYDEITIANDSCYAPLFPLEIMFEKMRAQKIDFWGNTDSRQLHYHLQSYFVVFNKAVIVSPVFKAFWNSIAVQKTKEDIVFAYEVGLTKTLNEAGFSSQAYCSVDTLEVHTKNKISYVFSKICRAIKNPKKILPYFKRPKAVMEIMHVNPSIYLYEDCLVRQSPFLKVQLIRASTGNSKQFNEYMDAVKLHSGYDVELIKKHLLSQ